MKALRYYGARDVRYEAMDDPAPQSNRDAVVQISACSICGSDLHIYHGHGFSEDVGFCVGHEAVGEVVEVGNAVHRVKVGDKVMLPAAVGCGTCRSCLAGNVGCLFTIQGERDDVNLFGESQSFVVATCREQDLEDLEELARQHRSGLVISGETAGDRLRVEFIDVTLDEMREAHESGLPRALEGVTANA